MSGQEFAVMQASGLLHQVEEVVVDGHRRWHEEQGRPWAMSDAYRWLRFESDSPVQRLQEGTMKLESEGVSFDQDAVEKVCSQAHRLGFSN